MANKRGQSDGEAVPGAVRGEEGDGGAPPPPPSPPASTPQPPAVPSYTPPPPLSSPSSAPPAHTAGGRRNILKALFLERKTSAGVPLRRVVPENQGIYLIPKVQPNRTDQTDRNLESELFNSSRNAGNYKDAAQDACPDAAGSDRFQVKPYKEDHRTKKLDSELFNSFGNIGKEKDAWPAAAARDRFPVEPNRTDQINRNLESELFNSWGNTGNDKDAAQDACLDAAGSNRFQIELYQRDQRDKKLEAELLNSWGKVTKDKVATLDAWPAAGARESFQDNQSKKDHAHRKNYLESELVQSCGSSAEDKDMTQDIRPAAVARNRREVVSPGCAPSMTPTKFLRTMGRRKEWGKTFELRFGNRTAGRQISAEASISGSRGIGDPGSKDHNNRSNEHLLPLVVSSIHDLLSFNPETAIIEFDSELGGNELGHLFRVARVLKFTYFVPNYTLARARLHYICSSCDGELHGRNLKAEAEDLFCGHKKKKE